MDFLRSRYGLTVKQAKERLLRLRGDPSQKGNNSGRKSVASGLRDCISGGRVAPDQKVSNYEWNRNNSVGANDTEHPSGGHSQPCNDRERVAP